MAIYTDSKSAMGTAYPVNGIDGLPIGRVEPLLTPEQLKSRFLFGIPLLSGTKDPITNIRAQMTEDQLKDLIEGAIGRVEADCKVTLFPVQRKERQAYDALHYNSFLFFKLDHTPVTSIDRISIETAQGQEVFVIPLEWVEPGHMMTGQINLIPLAIANPTVGGAPVQGVGGMVYINMMSIHGWIPAFFSILYTSGFPDGKMPRIVNDLIGVYATLEVLGMLGVTNRETSSGLSIDGMSQNVGTPGPQLFQARIQELEIRKKELTGKIQNMFGKRFIIGDL